MTNCHDSSLNPFMILKNRYLTKQIPEENWKHTSLCCSSAISSRTDWMWHNIYIVCMWKDATQAVVNSSGRLPFSVYWMSLLHLQKPSHHQSVFHYLHHQRHIFFTIIWHIWLCGTALGQHVCSFKMTQHISMQEKRTLCVFLSVRHIACLTETKENE